LVNEHTSNNELQIDQYRKERYIRDASFNKYELGVALATGCN